ncbi:MAG: hypothetical protein MJZ83_04625 [Bacteroidaceae bacterium]|nr:hypothetical protein [Bacteroidaceae bacterium]
MSKPSCKTYLVVLALMVGVALLSTLSATHAWLFILQGLVMLIMVPVSRAMTRESKRKPAKQVAMICTLFIICWALIGYILFMVNW